jgi:membrane fusion protein, multidrug efflux system
MMITSQYDHEIRTNDLVRKRNLYLIIGLMLISLFACSGHQATGSHFSMPPTPVEAATATTQTVQDKFDAVGTIEADQAISIVSEIDAAVVSLPFEEGTAVKAGQLIAQLDDSQLAAEVSRTDALRAQCKASYDRVKAIVDQGAGSQQDLDDASAALKVAEANLALAQARIAKTRIVAPFDGIVGVRYVSVGTFMRMGQAITELANTYNLRVSFSAPENFLSQLNRGAEVTISTTSYPNQVKGKIIAIEPVIDANTRNVRLVARIPNPQQRLRPGMSANISAILSERPNAITIPSEAVFASGNQSFVFVIKPDSTVARAGVELGTRMPDAVEVVAGLLPGTLIVKAGHQKLYDGAKVMPITVQDPAAPNNSGNKESN